MFSDLAAIACYIFVRIFFNILAVAPSFMCVKVHPPRLAKEEQLAVSFFSIFVAIGLYPLAMLCILFHALTTDSCSKYRAVNQLTLLLTLAATWFVCVSDNGPGRSWSQVARCSL